MERFLEFCEAWGERYPAIARLWENAWAEFVCVYMAITSLDPTGTGRRRWAIRWKPALNAFDIAFDGRLSAGRK
jgi:putative transposase